MIKYIWDSEAEQYNVVSENKIYLGYLYKEVDNQYVWYPIYKSGNLSHSMLVNIGNKLEELNKEFKNSLE